MHSCIYYVLDGSVVSDGTWQRWADELAALQAQFTCKIGYYDEAFEGGAGATGHDLPLRDRGVLGTAIWLLKQHEQTVSEQI